MSLMHNKRAWLARNSLFFGLDEAILDDLALSFNPRTLPANTLVMMEDHASPALCLIAKGTVKVSLSREGRETLLNIAGESEILGELSLLDEGGHSADILTLEETTLLWIERQKLLTHIQTQPLLALNLARVVSRRLRLATSRIEALSTLDVPGRVAFQLLAFAREYGQETPDGTLIPLCLTQSDLAALIGSTRTRVNQALGAMRRSQLISIASNQHITVLNSALLRRRFVGAR